LGAYEEALLDPIIGILFLEILTEGGRISPKYFVGWVWLPYQLTIVIAVLYSCSEMI
jgi:hypothetical protein